MDLNARVRRRRQTGGTASLVLDYESINPIAHPSEPVGRGSTLERLLDYLDPVFDGELPSNGYIWGPMGAGKSACLTALFETLSVQLDDEQSIIHTSTRTRSPDAPQFVYVDSREARSTFALYRAVLSKLTSESIPAKGVGTETLEARIIEQLRPIDEQVLLAVDHIGEPETPELSTLAEMLDPFAASMAWIAIGRTDPTTLSTECDPDCIEISAYRRQELVDILTDRASEGLSERALKHDQTRDLADWADGNAHDAFAALFGAADSASSKGRSEIYTEDLITGKQAVPQPCSSLGRVMALPANRQLVLRRLVDLGEKARGSVERTTESIADAVTVDLSPGTVKRFLYELAEAGIIERVRQQSESAGHGRPPSRVEPRFPTAVFRRLYDTNGG